MSLLELRKVLLRIVKFWSWILFGGVIRREAFWHNFPWCYLNWEYIYSVVEVINVPISTLTPILYITFDMVSFIRSATKTILLKDVTWARVIKHKHNPSKAILCRTSASCLTDLLCSWQIFECRLGGWHPTWSCWSSSSTHHVSVPTSPHELSHSSAQCHVMVHLFFPLTHCVCVN